MDGSTQWMIDRLIESILLGQPRSIVVGHDYCFASYHLLPMVVEELRDKGIIPSKIMASVIHLEEGVWVRFVGAYDIQRVLRGQKGCGVFWDHEAERRYPDLVDSFYYGE